MSKASILIVDDDISLGRSLSLVLKHKGYAVTTAQGGREALVEVKERPFDLVFMDIKMPALNGVETYKKMKKVRPGIMVVMMTGYSVEGLVQEAVNNNAYTCLYKPFDVEKMLRLIGEIQEGKPKSGYEGEKWNRKRAS